MGEQGKADERPASAVSGFLAADEIMALKAASDERDRYAQQIEVMTSFGRVREDQQRAHVERLQQVVQSQERLIAALREEVAELTLEAGVADLLRAQMRIAAGRS